MKNILFFAFLGFSLTLFGQDKETVKNFVENFIEYRKLDKTLTNGKNDLLVSSILKSNVCENCYLLSIRLDSKDLLSGYTYEDVFSVDGMKLIVFKNEYSKIFDKIYNKIPFEDMNLGKGDILRSFRSWDIVYNKDNDIVTILGIESKLIEKFLRDKKSKFANNYKL